MEGEDLTLGHEIMHDAEKAFLHLAGVLGAEDHHFPSLKVKIDAGGGGHEGGVTIAGEHSSVVDGEVWSAEILQLLFSGSDAHVVHEQGMVSPSRHNPNLDPVLRVPVQELVVHKHLVQRVQVVHSPLSVHQETVLVHLDVRRTPSKYQQTP